MANVNRIFGNTIIGLSKHESDFDLDNDLFLLASRDKYLSGDYHSRHVKARDLCKALADDIRQHVGFGTMAYRNADEYSPVSHNHDSLYNKLDISYDYPTSFPSNYPLVQPTDALSIGNMFVDGILSTVYIPLNCVENYFDIPASLVEPEFGEIRFQALDNVQKSIDYKSNDFDGWLWLDGETEYDLTAFRLANQIFDTVHNTAAPFVDLEHSSSSTKKFKLKNANCFFKVDVTDDFSDLVNYHNAKVRHMHNVSLYVNGTATCLAELSVAPQAGNGGYIHIGTGYSRVARNNNMILDSKGHISSLSYNGTDPEIQALLDDPLSSYLLWGDVLQNKVMTSQLDLSARVVFDMTTTSVIGNAKEDRETHPSHRLLPVMVYVGKKQV